MRWLLGLNGLHIDCEILVWISKDFFELSIFSLLRQPIASRFVGHCRMHPTLQFLLQNKRQSSALRAEDVLLFFGKHKLVIWNEDGVEKRGVSYFKVHPQWDPFAPAFDADLALIRMESPVTYSAYIRPVCLWNFQADLNSVVGQMGNVVGWGE
jgi:Trypsin